MELLAFNIERAGVVLSIPHYTGLSRNKAQCSPYVNAEVEKARTRQHRMPPNGLYLLLKHNPCFPTPSSRNGLHSTNSFPHSGSNSLPSPAQSLPLPQSLSTSLAALPPSPIQQFILSTHHMTGATLVTRHSIVSHRSYSLRPYRIEVRWTMNRSITNVITHVLHMTTEIIR